MEELWVITVRLVVRVRPGVMVLRAMVGAVLRVARFRRLLSRLLLAVTVRVVGDPRAVSCAGHGIDRVVVLG